jgi:hypothetical protein
LAGFEVATGQRRRNGNCITTDKAMKAENDNRANGREAAIVPNKQGVLVIGM